MKIVDLVGRSGPLVSFEFFPPKTPEGDAALVRTIDALRPLGPSFVSVTRTGGKPREATIELVARIEALGIPAAAHITGVEATPGDIAGALELIAARGIQNMVVLRGDVPKDPGFRRPDDGFRYAADLVRFVRRRAPGLCLAGACHPEGHPETRDLALEVEHLRAKVDAGVDLVITNMFYVNAHYFAFVDRIRRAGLKIPVVAGLMPITNLRQIARMADLCGAEFPAALAARLEALRDDPAGSLDVAVEWTTRQCAELLRGGAPGIHFYTLNQSPATRAIFENLRGDGLIAR
ncbi:MAG TPA: methylenetetrahydrofolate reductase [Candidatus Polarisedimenticolaceae bacterium]|nr:methylenetetrahydrofolate reductase [Candidatus Polarisedimenticolaceae bacterium]